MEVEISFLAGEIVKRFALTLVDKTKPLKIFEQRSNTGDIIRAAFSEV